jgi:hypothetical protein
MKNKDEFGAGKKKKTRKSRKSTWTHNWVLNFFVEMLIHGLDLSF